MSDIQAAEERMLSIEQRILSIESSKCSSSTSSADVEQALNHYQKQILVKLKAVRDQIMEEGGDVSTIKKERDEAIAQNVLLKKEIEKLNYRVRHLIKELNEEEKRIK